MFSVPLQLDGGVVSLSMEELKTAYPNVRFLVGKSLYVKASVLTKSGIPFFRIFPDFRFFRISFFPFIAKNIQYVSGKSVMFVFA